MEKVYEIITDRIIGLLEKGVVPWRKPWGGEERRPQSLVSERPYRGINSFVLAATGYDAPYWLSFKQAKHLGGMVKKGEHGYPCIYWNWVEKEGEDAGNPTATVKIPFLRYYTVFNVEQCDGIEYPSPVKEGKLVPTIEECEKIVGGMHNPPMITFGGTRACYRPSTDWVSIPKRESFDSAESYYSVLYHELIHSTGHEKRLNRPGLADPIVFGSAEYSKEELVAEMGATFLCGYAGIEQLTIENSASYIASWLYRLRKDQKLVVQAAAQAQKAADHILWKTQKIKDGTWEDRRKRKDAGREAPAVG